MKDLINKDRLNTRGVWNWRFLQKVTWISLQRAFFIPKINHVTFPDWGKQFSTGPNRVATGLGDQHIAHVAVDTRISSINITITDVPAIRNPFNERFIISHALDIWSSQRKDLGGEELGHEAWGSGAMEMFETWELSQFSVFWSDYLINHWYIWEVSTHILLSYDLLYELS